MGNGFRWEWAALTRAATRTTLAAALLVTAVLPAMAGAAGVTNSGSDLRDGWYGDQPGLNPDVVQGNDFGQLWEQPVDGQVYAQPLVSKGSVIVATERNHVYALNPANGAEKWHTALPNPPFRPGTDMEPGTNKFCNDLLPDVGITGTPVVDEATNTIYLVHKGYTDGTKTVVKWWMDALDLSTGAQKSGFPVEIKGNADNAPSIPFAPRTQMQRPGLLLMNGVVYAAFGAHCDIFPYQGWVFGVGAVGSGTPGHINAKWASVTSGSGAGIWHSGSGIMSDGSGRMFVATGNGGSPTSPTPGTSPTGMFGESVIRLEVQPDGKLLAKDFFAPLEAPSLDEWDADFASGGVTALRDDVFGTASRPHLAIAVGKSGYVYLLDRDNLGGFRQGTAGADKVVQRLGPYGGVWARPAVWPGDGGWVYVPTVSSPGTGEYNSAGTFDIYQNSPKADGTPQLARVAAGDVIGYGSSSPVVTSDGTTSGTALVWMVWLANAYGDDAQLRVYDAKPQNGKPKLLRSWPLPGSNTGSKFNPPGIGGNRVFVGTRDGKVHAYGTPADATITGGSKTFPKTTVGQTTGPVTVALRASRTVTITSVTASPSPFTADTSGLLPATLNADDTLNVPLRFAPAASGPVGGTLTVTTSEGTFTFTLSGTGRAATAELGCTQPLISFSGVVIGESRTETLQVCNTGAQPLTINHIEIPGAPFSAVPTDVPADGTVLAVDSAPVSIPVTFTPTATGAFTGDVVVQTNAGTKTIGLAGSGARGRKLIISPLSIDFGDVVAGGAGAVRTFTISNGEDAPVTVMKSKPPEGVFQPLDAIDEATTLEPGASRAIRVRFTPSALGPQSASWSVTGNDDQGVQTVTFSGAGVLATSPPPDPTPPSPPPLDPGPGTGIVIIDPPGPSLRVAAALKVTRRTVDRSRRTLTVTGTLAKVATGRVTATLSAKVKRKTVKATKSAKPRAGRFTVRLTIPKALRGVRKASLKVNFAGDGKVKAQALRAVTVKLRR